VSLLEILCPDTQVNYTYTWTEKNKKKSANADKEEVPSDVRDEHTSRATLITSSYSSGNTLHAI